jgi:TonB family protein
MLRALKKNGGVIQLCILSDYIKARKIDPEQKKLQDDLNARIAEFGGYEALREKPGGEALLAEARALRAKFGGLVATVKDAVDHIDHIVKLIGIDHVGIGTDFDGGGALVDCFDVTELPNITIELVRRGYSEKDIRKIWGENALRVFEQAQKNRAAGAAKPAPQGEGSDVAQNFTFNDMEVTYKPPAPPYPKMAMAAKIGGPVTLEMVIGADGVPTSATAISGHELLRGTATEWAKNWRFKPAVVDGRTVPARFTMGLNFMLPK